MRALAMAADAVATPDLRRLQLAWAFAAVGGWAFMIVLAVHAFAVGGATAVGLAALVRMLPAGAAAPLLGMVADSTARRRLDRSRVAGYAGVEIMRRLLGVAQLPLAYGVDRKLALLAHSRRLVLDPQQALA